MHARELPKRRTRAHAHTCMYICMHTTAYRKKKVAREREKEEPLGVFNPSGPACGGEEERAPCLVCAHERIFALHADDDDQEEEEEEDPVYLSLAMLPLLAAAAGGPLRALSNDFDDAGL